MVSSSYPIVFIDTVPHSVFDKFLHIPDTVSVHTPRGINPFSVQLHSTMCVSIVVVSHCIVQPDGTEIEPTNAGQYGMFAASSVGKAIVSTTPIALFM